MFLSGFVSIPPPKAGAPQGISLRAGPDRSDLVIITKILIEIRVRVQIHGDPVQLFAICLFLVPADPTCGAPREKKMETKYTGELWEKRRAKPICFVSRNQKRPRRHISCFLETKHAQNLGLFPMFPFFCVSTSTLQPTTETQEEESFTGEKYWNMVPPCTPLPAGAL